MELSETKAKELIAKSFDMLKMSYAPYSHFHVGAALLCENDIVFTGCNVENAAYGPSNCAERTAIFKAVSEGYRNFKAIAIVGGLNGKVSDYCFPCGVCRQVMSEFCKEDFKIIVAKSLEDYKVYSFSEILPFSFSLEK